MSRRGYQVPSKKLSKKLEGRETLVERSRAQGLSVESHLTYLDL